LALFACAWINVLLQLVTEFLNSFKLWPSMGQREWAQKPTMD